MSLCYAPNNKENSHFEEFYCRAYCSVFLDKRSHRSTAGQIPYALRVTTTSSWSHVKWKVWYEKSVAPQIKINNLSYHLVIYFEIYI
jgi:hypothetical protein